MFLTWNMANAQGCNDIRKINDSVQVKYDEVI